jgi:hypothetical protein
MIHIDFDPTKLTGPQQTWWTDWEATASAATEEVLSAWETWRNDPSDTSYKKIFERADLTKVWTELKKWLLANVFSNKCAYCETAITRFTFHAEHYWPKGKVTNNNKPVQIKDELDQHQNHPGYFWLAFHWTNLLPACEFCNTGNGKRNEFPIPGTTYLSVFKKLTKTECKSLKQRLIQSKSWPDVFYFQPVDLDHKEGRLLLHPYLDDPRKSLTFDDFGQAVPKGKGDDKRRGEESIRVFNLNDGNIVPLRRKAQDDALDTFETFRKIYRKQELSLDAANLKAKEQLEEYLTGKAPYSAAVLAFMRIAHPDYF